jgi:hypothetical protein
MAHAAAAAVALCRPFLLSLKPARLLSSLAPALSGLRHASALRPAGPVPSDAGDAAVMSFKKSRNELKREARRAVQWGMELAKFSPAQIKRILRCAPQPPRSALLQDFRDKTYPLGHPCFAGLRRWSVRYSTLSCS